MAGLPYELDARHVDIANPDEAPIEDNNLDNSELWVIAVPLGYDAVHVAVWTGTWGNASGIEEALEGFAEWAVDNAPGLITTHEDHNANLVAGFVDAGLEVEDEIPWDDDEYREIVEEAEEGLMYTESGYVSSEIRADELRPFENLQKMLGAINSPRFKKSGISPRISDVESAAVAIDWLEETGYGPPKPDLYAKLWKKSIDEMIGMRVKDGSHVDEDELEELSLIAFAFGLGGQWVGLSGEWSENEDEE